MRKLAGLVATHAGFESDSRRTRAAERGVQIFAFGPRMVRAVTHLDVSREQCARAADIMADVAETEVRSRCRRV